jgi:hypothetical protein
MTDIGFPLWIAATTLSGPVLDALKVWRWLKAVVAAAILLSGVGGWYFGLALLVQPPIGEPLRAGLMLAALLGIVITVVQSLRALADQGTEVSDSADGNRR